jgi:hypothetical protein
VFIKLFLLSYKLVYSVYKGVYNNRLKFYIIFKYTKLVINSLRHSINII